MFKHDLVLLRESLGEVQDDPARQVLAEAIQVRLRQFEALQSLSKDLLARNGGEIAGIELSRDTETGKRYCAILPQPCESGGARLVFFTDRLLFSHEDYNCLPEAFVQALIRGYTQWASGSMDRFAVTPEWRKALALSDHTASYSVREMNGPDFRRRQASRDDNNQASHAFNT